MDRLDKECHPDVTFASDLRSAVVQNPVRRMYYAIIMVQKLRDEVAQETRNVKDEADPDSPIEP